MIEHPNSLLMHHCLQAANEGDRHTLLALWAPDIVLHVRGMSTYRDDIKGPDDILDYLSKMGGVGVTGLKIEVDDVMVSSERAAMICHTYAELDDRTIDADFVVIAEILGRRIQKITTVPMDPDRVTELWSI